MKKLISILLTALMLIGMTTVVSASNTAEITTDIVGYSDARVEKKDLTNVPSIIEYISNQQHESKEFKISTPLELDVMSTSGLNYAGITIYLATDLDMSETSFVSIGGPATESSTVPFRGTFDGQGYEVDYINSSATKEGLGFFSNLQGATVKNLIIGENSKFKTTGNNRTGGIAANITGDKGMSTTIDNCWNKATIEGVNFVGGIVAFPCVTKKNGLTVNGETVTEAMRDEAWNNTVHYIKNCTNSGNVTGTGRDVGGISGAAQVGMEITNCRNTGKVTAEGSDATKGVGGIIARAEKSAMGVKVIGCINNGEVVSSGTTAAASMIGLVNIPNCEVKDCKNFSAITAANATNAAFYVASGTNIVAESGNSGTTEAADDATLEIALKADTLIVGEVLDSTIPTIPGGSSNETPDDNKQTEKSDDDTEAADTTAEATEADDTQADEEEKGGCGAVVATSVTVMSMIALAGAVVCKKRK